LKEVSQEAERGISGLLAWPGSELQGNEEKMSLQWYLNRAEFGIQRFSFGD
jgi:hypothetical protein